MTFVSATVAVSCRPRADARVVRVGTFSFDSSIAAARIARVGDTALAREQWRHDGGGRAMFLCFSPPTKSAREPPTILADFVRSGKSSRDYTSIFGNANVCV